MAFGLKCPIQARSTRAWSPGKVIVYISYWLKISFSIPYWTSSIPPYPLVNLINMLLTHLSYFGFLMNHHVTKTCIMIKFIILNCSSTQEKCAIILILFISIKFETRTFHEQFATKRSKTLPFAVISNPSVCNNQHHLSQYFYLFVSSSSSRGQSRPTAGKAYG